MELHDIRRKVESENNNRIHIAKAKFRNCLCLFNSYSKCYLNIKKSSNRETSKYDKIYGNENIRIREEKKANNSTKETSLEFTYPYRYEQNRSVFLIINSENINSGNSSICHNDIIYIIYNNKKYEHVNVQKRKKKREKIRKKKKKKKDALHDGKGDNYGSLIGSIPNQPFDTNPMYNSTIFETSNMNFGETYDSKKKKKREKAAQAGIDALTAQGALSSKTGKLKNKKNFIYSDDDDSDNNYEHIFTHINSNLHFLSVSNDHIEKEKNLYIQNERYVNCKDVIFRKMKFKKTMFLNLDTYNSWIIIKKSILVNEYLSRLAKNDLVDINDVLYDVVNMPSRVLNCYTKVYINDYFLLINNKTKEILGVQKVPAGQPSMATAHKGSTHRGSAQTVSSHTEGETNPDKKEPSFRNSMENSESKYYNLVLIKKMSLSHLFGTATDINITFAFHNVCLTSYNKINDNSSYMLIYNYNLTRESQIFLIKSSSQNEQIRAPDSHNIQQGTSHEDYLYFNNYITKKIAENYLSYSLYIKECLIIIDILYVLNNSHGNLIYIKEHYKYDHQTYYSYVCDVLQRGRRHPELGRDAKGDSSSVYSLSSDSEQDDSDEGDDDGGDDDGGDDDEGDGGGDAANDEESSASASTDASTASSEQVIAKANLTSEEKQLFDEMNNDLVYLMPKYKLVFHPLLLSDRESNSSHLEITREILKLGICLRRIQRFIEINKRGQSCNSTFDMFCCCLYNISMHILNHVSKIEENVRNIYNFSKIYMKDGTAGGGAYYPPGGNKTWEQIPGTETQTRFNDLPMCLFDANALSTCTDPEEKKIFFSINNLFRKNVHDFNLFFNINIDKAEDISLYKIKIIVLPLLQIAKLLNKIINKIITKKQMNNSKYLIDLIYKLQEYLHSDSINKTVLMYLLKNITTPLFDFIKNYIFYGKVKDTHREFFIHENRNITPYYKQTNKFYCTNIFKYIYKRYIDMSTNYWGAKYVILNSKVPTFLRNVSYHIFITGKYIDVLSACSKLLTLQSRRRHRLCMDGADSHNDSATRGWGASEVDNLSVYAASKRTNHGRESSSSPQGEIYQREAKNPWEEQEEGEEEQDEQDELYNSNTNRLHNNKTCLLIYDGNKKTYEHLIHNQHLFASKKMFELYIKKIDIKEKIKHHYFFFFLQISDYLKYFYILAHEHLEKLYNSKKNSNVLNKLRNFFDISLRSSVLYHLKYRHDYNVDVSDILSIIDNVNLIIDLRNFYLNISQVHVGRGDQEDALDNDQANDGTALLTWQQREDQSGPYYQKGHLQDGNSPRGAPAQSEDDTDLDSETESPSEADQHQGGASLTMKEQKNRKTKKKTKKKMQKRKKKNYGTLGKNTQNGRNLEQQHLLGKKKKILANLKNNVLTNIHNNMQTNTNVEIYKGLVLSYHNMFPYNLIFNNVTIFKYTLIFRFLNYCKYIEHKLTEVWLNHMFVKNIFINEECRNNLMMCIHTRECMTHFLKCYTYHLQNDVIKSEYTHMNIKLKETLIFDDIIHIHNAYLNNILRYSFIMNQNIINSILKLISISHIFTRHILKFNFNKNEQLERVSSRENAKGDRSGGNPNGGHDGLGNQGTHGHHDSNNGHAGETEKKKKKKNNYHRKFIQELLSDQAYISMIHNTIKHYDKHFRNFFLHLTDYVSNNIDDYAHNFLIKLDYNFYYTNKYKISNAHVAGEPNEEVEAEAAVNSASGEYRTGGGEEHEGVATHASSFQRGNLAQRGRNLDGRVGGPASGIPTNGGSPLSSPNRLAYNQQYGHTGDHLAGHHADHSAVPYEHPPDHASLSHEQATYAAGYSTNYEANPPQVHSRQRYGHPSRGTTHGGDQADYNRSANEHSVHYADMHSPVAHRRNNYPQTHLNKEHMLSENRFAPYHLSSQNAPYGVNPYEKDGDGYDRQMGNPSNSGATYSKLKKYGAHNNENLLSMDAPRINAAIIKPASINVSGIDVNSVDQSAYKSKFIPQ
ncbi:hypothetical protein C922_03979 [Plasmodium inui San Antonio 1]|uniref:Uncharacterized protein n=1 Tax=Plasmodium inui San Antonio 1 TaxID=1237626 RepID=W7AK69_9APIC|nr:hypothetical protein C922_03979 [Plasmodium inui San Antonio 1]EUD65731.1 hypothetical protein C922_03979 [Plasmodium inui San Antonio 1]